ncbi:hypothetical protein PS896_01691 [Pseudomonas fluorescens]|uniref:Uncharacterized protein n=1 Tax=Pseudomonas fluorescens TaxID=294 RepID=A0A5E7INJ4_PSEFL|nr:hypothetical protein [Pseudomonas fluorescens]VVO78025.1 hypothetical protein PS896_01691 [Pseudomonas fluorescens]
MSRVHEQRFFTCALRIVGIAQHDELPGLGVPGYVRVEARELLKRCTIRLIE